MEKSHEVAQGTQAGDDYQLTPEEIAERKAFNKWRMDGIDGLICSPSGAAWLAWQARAALATQPAAAHGDEAVRIDARLLELYQAPFRFDERGGYIWDAQNNMVADNHVDGDQAMRVRGWGRLSYRQDGEEVQDLMGQAMADALTARWEAAMRAQGDGHD